MYKFVSQSTQSPEGNFTIVNDDGVRHPFASNWLDYLADCGHSPNTLLAYGRRLAGYLSWCHDNVIDWKRTRLTDILHWRGHLAREMWNGHVRRRASTVAAWTTSVVMFLRWAQDHAGCSELEVDRLLVEQVVPSGVFNNRVGYQRKVVAPELRVGTQQQGQRAEWISSADHLAHLRELEMNTRDRFLVDLLDATALRCGEALNLFREDLHLLPRNHALGCSISGPHIHVKQNPNANGSRTKSGERWIPIDAELAESYARYREERMHIVGVDSDPHVFINLYGKAVGSPLRYDTVIALFRRISSGLGTRVRPHMLRHTRATIWARGLEGTKVDLDILKELLGHASLESTRIYTHVSAEELRIIVRRASLRTTSHAS